MGEVPHCPQRPAGLLEEARSPVELGTQAWRTESPAVPVTAQPPRHSHHTNSPTSHGATAQGCPLPGLVLIRVLSPESGAQTACCPSGHSSSAWSSNPNLNTGIVCANAWELRGEAFQVKENIPVIGSPWNPQHSHF